MRILNNLKTSTKITFLFTLFNFISLIILLVAINIIYFFAWYSDQKSESMYDMNVNYKNMINSSVESNIEAFKEYILEKDTLIIPKDWWELICSNWVETRIHNDIEKIKDNLFIKVENKIYFIFSEYYDEIWEVKVFFDTTPYVKSQIIIIKISLIIILISLLLYFVIWSKITKYSLENLKEIAKKIKNPDIEKNYKKLVFTWNKDDEINILVESLNTAFYKIEKQTDNLKQFISDVSHEFKTPLMIINSQVDLFNKKEEKWVNKELDIKDLLLKIKNNTKKLNKLIETLFTLSRITEWIEEFSPHKTNMLKLVNWYILEYKPYLEEKDLWVKIDIDKNLDINIDKNTFNIIFDNLFTNAIKFSKKWWIIEINADKTKFEVTNYWETIKKVEIDKIWGKFYKKDKNKEWFWIWLYLVNRITNLYKWSINAKSLDNWKTTFTIKF